MAEYIEREASCRDCLHYELCVELEANESPCSCMFFKPAADVAEVRLGVWLDYADKYDRGMDLRCSICGNRASNFVGGTEDWWDSYKPNYCPHCGAKMDGKGEGE